MKNETTKTKTAKDVLIKIIEVAEAMKREKTINQEALDLIGDAWNKISYADTKNF